MFSTGEIVTSVKVDMLISCTVSRRVAMLVLNLLIIDSEKGQFRYTQPLAKSTPKTATLNLNSKADVKDETIKALMLLSMGITGGLLLRNYSCTR